MRRDRRPGLTLVELLVVIALITVLATLTIVYVVPAFQDNRNVQRGLERTVSALLGSRMRALRDQAPRGIRFVPDADGFCRNLRVIEQPDSYRVGTVAVTASLATFSGSNLLGSAVAGDTDNYAVQPGDWLQIGLGATANNYQISLVASGTTATLWQTLTTPIPNGPFKIIRQSRPIAGEEVIKLPENVGININQITTLSASNQIPLRANTVASGVYEVMFDPSGGVVNRSTQTPIVLWVQDTTASATDPNTTKLIAIYPRTGLIASHPLAPSTSTNGYLTFALDGKSSGS
jgi:prepilin-type N-terminal cleavage/methylation domain-containing protein